MTNEEIIVALKDTCVMLDERKAQFELMISTLERKDTGTEVEEDVCEKEAEDEEGSGNEDKEADDKDEEEASRSSSEVEE
jgi:hypothetical protein